MSKQTSFYARLTAQTLFLMLTATIAVHAQGIFVTGVGPVNRSMGGAGTAAPLDAIGALHWNPASISGLATSELGFGVETLLADIDLSSTIGGVNAKTSGEPGTAVIPTIGWVHHLEDSPVTIGLGVNGVGGFRNNMPMDANNPLLDPAAGGTPFFADAEIFQLTPTLSYALNDHLSIGVAPTITAHRLSIIPLGPPIIPAPGPSQGNRVHWGGGVQVGLYYITDRDINLGLSVKSPQWMENSRFFTPGGVVKFDLDYPLIVSLGTAYTGIEGWTFAADFRYFDYKSADGFGDFRWKSIFAAAFGVQHVYNDRWTFRAGYNFNQNPINAANAFTNLVDPLIQEQNIAFGATYHLASNVDFNLAYVYLVKNSLTGPLPAAVFGPSATVSHEIEAHSAVFGVTVHY